MNSAAWNETTDKTRRIPARIPAPLLDSSAPHPLKKLAERLGRSPGRQPLPDIFEQFLIDQLTRPIMSPEVRSAVMPSRDLTRRRGGRTRRADV
jgi:hypothetical protein